MKRHLQLAQGVRPGDIEVVRSLLIVRECWDWACAENRMDHMLQAAGGELLEAVLGSFFG